MEIVDSFSYRKFLRFKHENMSLRSKIILLFLGLAIVPLLTLASFSHRQARRLLVETFEGQLQEDATTVGRGFRTRVLEIQGALEELAGSRRLAEALGGDMGTGLGEMTLNHGLDQAVFLQVSDPSGLTRTLRGSVPEKRIRRSDRGDSRLLEFTAALPGHGEAGSLRVGYWASDLLPRGGGSSLISLVLLDARDGEIVFGDGSSALSAGETVESYPGLTSAVTAQGNPSGVFRFRDADGARLGAYFRTSDERWALVASSSSRTALASLNRLVTAYWAFVLALAVITAFAFSFLLGHFTKSLTDLAQAAERIGAGELDQWLPLPSSGEVGKLTLAFNRMLERFKEMMNQVDQSGRLAVVGQLSAYLAHEIRNPLSSIKMNLQRLERWTHLGRLPESCLEPLEISLREVERLTASVSDVLQLSRAQDAPPVTFSLHDQVDESAQLLLPKFTARGVELRLDLDAEADLVRARPGQVKSAILNLMLNALEAQPDGGFLEIRSELTMSRVFGGPSVTVRFGDGGPGIPEAVRNRIFQPFFTTKNGGSGIGLAMADRAVRESGGRLFLEAFPRVGSGAEFVMTLPLAAVGADAVPAAESLQQVLRDHGHQENQGIPTGDGPSSETPEIPAHLMTPQGLEALMALSRPDPEEIN